MTELEKLNIIMELRVHQYLLQCVKTRVIDKTINVNQSTNDFLSFINSSVAVK